MIGLEFGMPFDIANTLSNPLGQYQTDMQSSSRYDSQARNQSFSKGGGWERENSSRSANFFFAPLKILWGVTNHLTNSGYLGVKAIYLGAFFSVWGKFKFIFQEKFCFWGVIFSLLANFFIFKVCVGTFFNQRAGRKTS